MTQQNWTCPKCGNRTYETDEMQATGGILAKLFDVQNKKFTAVTCEKCRYTELYKEESGMLGNIFDFLSQ
ncbi:MAG: zinc ribbon domain-containing protein [Bacteroidota bacterium]|jgi:predicted nucleic-acid-binding Zn-ribbon protein